MVASGGLCDSAGRQVERAEPTADALQAHVTDFRVIVNDAEIPSWTKDLNVPAGWSVGRYAGGDSQRPWRVLAGGPQADGGWDACETLTVLGYAGSIPHETLVRHAENALIAMGGFGIVTQALISSEVGGPQAVQSKGYITAAGLLIWMCCNYYAAGSPSQVQGRLVEQSLMVVTSALSQFGSAVDELSESALRAFVGAAKKLR